MNTYQKPPTTIKDEKYKFPSHYGSHKIMVIKEFDIEHEQVDLLPAWIEHKVVCKDEFGDYITTPNRLDTGLHDSNRTDVSRMKGEYYNSIVNVKDRR